MSFTFKNFFNKVSNNNRIFTSKDIKNMSSKEFQIVVFHKNCSSQFLLGTPAHAKEKQ